MLSYLINIFIKQTDTIDTNTFDTDNTDNKTIIPSLWLPLDIWQEICKYLDTQSIIRLKTVSKQTRNIKLYFIDNKYSNLTEKQLLKHPYLESIKYGSPNILDYSNLLNLKYLRTYNHINKVSDSLVELEICDIGRKSILCDDNLLGLKKLEKILIRSNKKFTGLCLQNMKNLKVLDIYNCRIFNCKYLDGLINLEIIRTDSIMNNINNFPKCELPNLNTLYLSFNNIRTSHNLVNSNVLNFNRFANLTEMSLVNVGLDLGNLTELKKLEILMLNECVIYNASYITNFINLKEFSLDNTLVTDANDITRIYGKTLAKLPLRKFSCFNTNLDDRKIIKHLPNVRVINNITIQEKGPNGPRGPKGPNK